VECEGVGERERRGCGTGRLHNGTAKGSQFLATRVASFLLFAKTSPLVGPCGILCGYHICAVGST
jgi:hypothetical protein